MNGITIALIPARGGSKGVPGKNLRLLFGKPLLVHSIECGLASPSIDRVVVSTDSKEIAEVARTAGAEVPFMRPSNLAGDATPMIPVVAHAIEACEHQYSVPVKTIVLLHPTSPLRTPEDVENCLTILRESSCPAVISATPARRSPHFNMVVVKDGSAEIAMPTTSPITRRQDAPVVYDLDTSVWVYTRSAIVDQAQRIPAGTQLYVIPNERSSDLDTELDFRVLECLVTSRRRS